MEPLTPSNTSGLRLRRWLGIGDRNPTFGDGPGTRFARRAAHALFAVLVFAPGSLHAQLPLARLHTVFPPGGQAGTTITVTVTGSDLDDLSELVISHTNVVAKPDSADENGDSPPHRFQVTIGADVPTGVFEARVVGRFGISNPRAFVVGHRPEVSPPSIHHSPDSAVILEPNTVANGRLDTNAVDYFRFTAAAGQFLSIECQTGPIDSRMQEGLVVLDSSGRELARQRQGGPLDFRAPADGAYLLQVHDVTFRNGPEFFYRLVLNTEPRLDSLFPPSGPVGSTNTFTLQGRNFPGSSPRPRSALNDLSLETLAVEIALPTNSSGLPDSLSGLALPPASAGLDAIAYRFASAGAVSNPALLGISPDPVVVESEPNDTPEQAQPLQLPCELAGRFQTSQDRDWSSFEARKGDVFWVEVFSHRLGLPTDPFVLIQRVTRDNHGAEKATDVLELNDADTNIGGPGFNTATRDPVGRFEVPDDGTYRICLRNLFRNPVVAAPPFYRLSLHRESPDFRLVALPQAPPPLNRDTREALVWTPFLRRGETIPIRVLAFRRDGFKDAIPLQVEGLPPSVSCGPAQIDADKSSGQIFLTASADAGPWLGPVSVTGRARIGGADVTRSSRFAEVTWSVADYNNDPVQTRLTSAMLLAVSDAESSPVVVASAEARVWEAEPGARLQIPLRIERHGEFTETLKLKATGLAALESVKELEVEGKTNSATLELDLAQLKLPPGQHTFELQTQTKGKYRNESHDAKKTDASAREAGAAAKKAREGLDALKADAKQASKALAEAAKAADDLASQVKSVTEDEKPSAETRAAKALALKADAEKAATAATAAVKEAEEKKAALEKRARELEEKTKPKEVTITVYSAPITIHVKYVAKK